MKPQTAKQKARCGAIDTIKAIIFVCALIALLRYVLH